jgi:sigma-B regulation protein RsbU (phosphoserine phosphatase)
MRRRSSSPTEERRKTYEERFELGALFEFSTIINASLDLKFILGHFLLTLMGKLLSLRGIVLLEADKQTYRIECAKGVPLEMIGKEFKISKIPNRLMYVQQADGRKLPWTELFHEQGIHFLVPLAAGKKILGVAGFAPSVIKKKLRDKEATYVKSLANIAAAAVEKSLVLTKVSQVNRQLDGKVQELNTLFDLSKEFNAALDPERIVKLLTFSFMGQIGANRYFICLNKDGNMQVVNSRLDKEFNPDLYQYFSRVTSPIVTEGLTKKNDRQLQSLLREIGIQALVPLQLQNQTKGMLGLGEKMRGGGYTQTDLEFLFSLGNLAIISLENARLFHDALEKQKMEDDLIIAKEIQKGLLPKKLPEIPRFDLAATNISSKQVGGDYYDIIPLGNSKYVIAIGDVSGKGTPASLLMANLQATIRALVPIGLPLSELTKRVNDLICENTGIDRFITFFWGILDAETMTMNYVSAGHNPPFLFHVNGRIERLDKGGIILGFMKTFVPYQEGEVRFTNGDVLLLFTDGVSEAMNQQGEELGEDRLEEIAKSYLTESPLVILDKIVESVREHSKNTPQSDDITLVVAKAAEQML